MTARTGDQRVAHERLAPGQPGRHGDHDAGPAGSPRLGLRRRNPEWGRDGVDSYVIGPREHRPKTPMDVDVGAVPELRGAHCGPLSVPSASMPGDSVEYLEANTTAWEARREDQMELARRQWSSDEPTWGIFGVPESMVGVLPATLDGARSLELGCGTAYVSAWLARRGALPVGIDPTPGQLRIAREFQDRFGLWFPLLRAAGEQVPLRDESFDLVISEYGAAIWADPYRWVPEAARVLRPGGQLIFLGNSTLLMMCVPDEDDQPATDRLLRPQFGMHRVEWPDDPTVEFHLGHGDWIRVLRASGFDIEDLIELRPPEGARTGCGFVTLEWARRWPSEEVWRARRR